MPQIKAPLTPKKLHNQTLMIIEVDYQCENSCKKPSQPKRNHEEKVLLTLERDGDVETEEGKAKANGSASVSVDLDEAADHHRDAWGAAVELDEEVGDDVTATRKVENKAKWRYQEHLHGCGD